MAKSKGKSTEKVSVDVEKHLEDLTRQLKTLRQDGWDNVLTGIGVIGKDKRMGGRAKWSGRMEEMTAEEIYASSSLARRICDLLPLDGTRNWVKFTGLGEDTRKLEARLTQLNAPEMFKRGASWGRMYGGSALFMSTGVDGAGLAEPFDYKTEKVKALILMSRWELLVDTTNLDKDITSPNFGMPLHYLFNQRKGIVTDKDNIKIHFSRLIRFDGVELAQRLFVHNLYWHDSVFTGLLESMRDYEMGHSSISAVLQEFRVAVYKAAGLVDAVAAGDEELVKKRFKLLAALRSVLGSQVLDKEEEYEIHSDSFQGVDKMLERLKERFACNTEYPHIVLFNESPSGLGADGGANLEVYYNVVQAWQSTYLSPRLDILLKCLAAELGLEWEAIEDDTEKQDSEDSTTPDDEEEIWDYEWVKLWQETAMEAATREKTEAEADGLRLDQGVLDEVDVIEMRYPEKMEGQDPEKMREVIEEEKAAQMEEQQKLMVATSGPKQPAKKGADE